MDTWEYVARTSRNGGWPSGCASVRSPEIQISIIILKRTSEVSVMRTELGMYSFLGKWHVYRGAVCFPMRDRLCSAMFSKSLVEIKLPYA